MEERLELQNTRGWVLRMIIVSWILSSSPFTRMIVSLWKMPKDNSPKLHGGLDGSSKKPSGW
jgi:hypothetical protein